MVLYCSDWPNSWLQQQCWSASATPIAATVAAETACERAAPSYAALTLEVRQCGHVAEATKVAHWCFYHRPCALLVITVCCIGRHLQEQQQQRQQQHHSNRLVTLAGVLESAELQEPPNQLLESSSQPAIAAVAGPALCLCATCCTRLCVDLIAKHLVCSIPTCWKKCSSTHQKLPIGAAGHAVSHGAHHQ